MPGFFRKEKTIDELEAEQERMKLEATIAEQRAMSQEMKKRYGSGWTKMFSGVKSGIDWNAVKLRLK